VGDGAMNTRRFLASVVLAVGAAGLFGAGLWAQIPPREPPPPAPAIVSGVFVDSLGAPIRHAVLSVVGESLRVVVDSQGRLPEIVATVPGVRVRQSPDDPFKTYISFPRCTKITTELRGAFPQIPCRNCATPPERDPANDDRPTVAVYVDGFRAYGDPGRILSQINPADVLAVEVYRGPSEIPFEFMSVDCAVIAVWTQY